MNDGSCIKSAIAGHKCRISGVFFFFLESNPGRDVRFDSNSNTHKSTFYSTTTPFFNQTRHAPLHSNSSAGTVY